MSWAQTVTLNWGDITCFRCGIQFLVPSHWHQKRLEDKQSFWCPNGHSQAYVKSAVDELKAQLEVSRQQVERLREQRDRADRQASAAKGQVTKIKNRVSAGVCPCCNRTFQNLSRHMSGQHPEWKAQDLG